MNPLKRGFRNYFFSMLKKTKSGTRRRFKKTDINSFIFFLVFAVVIWIFVQFSKQYNEVINIPVQYVNIPPDIMLADDNPRILKLRMEKTGFKIAWYSLFPPTLYVDVSRAAEQDGKLLYFIDENRSDIISQLDIDFDDSRFVKDVLAINFQQKKEKKLKVIPRVEIEFAVGYSAREALQTEPDSVVVSGPDGLLDTLSVLYTEKLSLSKVKSDVSGTVKIDTSGMRGLTLYRPSINYEVEVEKFTEGSVRVPIELINVPEDLNVVIFPKETLLFFQVNLQDYSKVSPSDFRVVANFDGLQKDQDFLIPEIVQKPDFTANLRINEKKIQFIIKK